ncbi:hypothetical protein M413DRAFT_239194 [Hebeloma cylindrosporum]|uniref:Uncharacterized protein n=1 Tax=Hebeloma cylindrosporum TaxID=76867 RepID=A0A0C3BQH6_HEBCY|nr:hypothetical protein M413DRAFT_239194 [Hebeloma cylindrosporum h7]
MLVCSKISSSRTSRHSLSTSTSFSIIGTPVSCAPHALQNKWGIVNILSRGYEGPCIFGTR